MKFLVAFLVVLGLVRHPKAPETRTFPPIPPEPDPTLSMESYYDWANWAAAYSPWSLR